MFSVQLTKSILSGGLQRIRNISGSDFSGYTYLEIFICKNTTFHAKTRLSFANVTNTVFNEAINTHSFSRSIKL